MPAITNKIYNLSVIGRVERKRIVLYAWAIELRHIVSEPVAELSMDTAARWLRRHRDMESGGTAHRRTGIAMFHRHGAPPDGFASARALR